MRKFIKNLLLVGFLGLSQASAQDETRYGYVNIVNLIPAESGCFITIDGTELVPNGLKAGESTGWFLLPVGSKALKISQGELAEESGKLPVVDSEETFIAIYLQPNPKLGDDGKPLPPRIRIKDFPTFNSKGFGLRVASTCPATQRFELGKNKIELEQFKYITVPGWGGGAFEISHNGKPIGDAFAKNEPGAFYLLIGTDLKGNYTTALTRSDDRNGVDPLGREQKKQTTSSSR